MSRSEQSRPRIIWQYWETRGQKPAFVDGLYNIARMNSGCEVVRVTPETISHYLPDAPADLFRIEELAHKADMIRTMLVARYGGMWLDSDAVVLRDLNWLFDMLDEVEFIGFNNGGLLTRSRPWVRVNCFLSRPNGKVISTWVNRQHRKFPNTKYRWEEIGTELIHPICLKNRERVRIIPFERVCPIPWDHVTDFGGQDWPDGARSLDHCDMVMLSNAALGKFMPEMRTLSCAQMAARNDVAGSIIRHALGGRPLDERVPAAAPINIPRPTTPEKAMGFRSKVSSFIDRVLRRPRFENRAFWNERYTNAPVKGSGPGSRGENLALKNRLIREAIERHGVTSVLDIGCGDVAILQDIEIPHYVGIDISDVVVARNRALKPQWSFENIDAAGDGTVLPSSDLVLCLDVLIHQKSRANYERILQRALGAAKKLAIVSGYTKPDGGWNVFFHEPLEESIRRLQPHAHVALAAKYRDTELFEVQFPAAAQEIGNPAASVLAAAPHSGFVNHGG